MNTAKIKAYAPAARRDFIAAVTQRFNLFGIRADKQGKLKAEPATVTGSVLQIGGQTFDAKLARARERLVERAQSQGLAALVERVAYTWFNRLCAIRFMELQDGNYLEHGFRVLSHPEQAKGFQVLDHVPEVAAELGLDAEHLVGLKLAGNQDEALFRAILLGQCHALHQAMPFLFEALEDDTELLLPDNLTRTDSLLRPLVDAIPESDWQQVEIIGWLYQFYIAERKDQVIGRVVNSEDIPAATQLFTPNWIVQYLVQNSIGRQWLQTYPESGLKAQMPYYIEPAEQSAAVAAQLAALTPASLDPETLKVLDPACGSGHILVEAYQVLKAIYQERGYRLRDIPQLILEKNLYGLDIDERAAQLAGFALLMLARADDRRIFTRQVKLNVVALKEPPSPRRNPTPALPLSGEGARGDSASGSSPDKGRLGGVSSLHSLWQALNLRGDWQKGTSADLFGGGQMALGDGANDPVYQLLLTLEGLFREAKTFGSLIDVPVRLLPELQALQGTLDALAERGDTLQQPAARALLPLVRQAIILAQRYDAVVANPPYMGSKFYTPALKTFINSHYKKSKADLYTAFIEKNLKLVAKNGYVGMITIPNWMFLSSFEDIRTSILDDQYIDTFVHNGRGVWGSDFGSCSFVIRNVALDDAKGIFKRLFEKQGSTASNEELIDRFFNFPNYTAAPSDFKKIPGSPIAYWVSDPIRNIFVESRKMSDVVNAKQSLATAANDRFIRIWQEVSLVKIGFGFKNRKEAKDSKSKWFPHQKGGDFRKWYGNHEYLVNWENDGQELFNFRPTSVIRNPDYYFQDCVTWSDVTSAATAFRYDGIGFIPNVIAPTLFKKDVDLRIFLLSGNNKFYDLISKALNPTIHFHVGYFSTLPFPEKISNIDLCIADSLIKIAKRDWDSFEGSWDFAVNPLLAAKRESVKLAFAAWQAENTAAVTEMQRLEEENNRLFIGAYGLQDELTPAVPLEQITLTVNPRYRYGGNATDAELSLRFQSDTCAELISYALGCMMGRYRVDREGLVYAHSGNVDFWKVYEETPPNLPLSGEGQEQEAESPLAPSPDKGRAGVGFLPEAGGGVSSNVGEGGSSVFPPDDDGIIPLTDQEWFADDATHRFREFVRIVWGETRVQENLDFVALSLTQHALKPKRDESSLDTLRRYLSTQFYKDHLRTYKKRPIYWLFSSGKHKAFECLVYLHRYHEGTLARMRTEYVTPLLGKYTHYAAQLEQQAESADSTADKNRLKKELTALEKQRAELSAFDDQLKHYADRRITLDLDDGVKVNYAKFGELLADVKAVTGGKDKE